MGFLKDLVGVAAPIVGGIFGGPAGAAIGGALGSALGGGGGAQQSGTQTTTQQQQVDPRIQSMLFGSSGNNGLLNQFQGYLNEPRSAGSTAMGAAADQFLGQNAQQLLNNQYAATNALMKGYQEPSIQGAQAQAAQIQAPSQNALNLSPAYQNFIYGNAAENPYLKQSLQAGVDQSTQAFNTQLGNLTDTLQRNILPGIRGGAIASGQYGGSRQGIAEGLALSDLSKQATNAAQAFGLGNVAATTGAQANAFESGQNRALNAANTLSGQQYGVAQQQAQLDQQANLANAAARQAADMANVDALLRTRGQNSANMATGIQGTQNLLGTANNFVNQNDQYNINRAQQVAGLLSPFIGVNQSSTSSTPLYQNKTANALGGLTAGLGLFNTMTGDNSMGNSLFRTFGGMGGSM